MIDLPNILKRYRSSANLSQRQVAELLHIKLPTYQSYEEGRSEPRIEILIKLSGIYGITLQMFIFGNDPENISADPLRINFNQSPEFIKQTIRHLLNF